MQIHDVTSCIGMLSKSRGQILRVAATMHVLFHLDTPLTIPPTISEAALKAAQSFVELCNEHAAFLGGRGDIGEAIESIQQLRKGITVNTYFMWASNMHLLLTDIFGHIIKINFLFLVSYAEVHNMYS